MAEGVPAARVLTGPGPGREGWAYVKRSLANLVVVALGRLEALVRNRLKRLQCRSGTLDGFMAGTGPALDEPASP
ncbi:hypothetical protein ACF1FC_13250 [Streptomyces sp. NPDC014344]|uniref:hypothetical protein n=1 Tax=Streptomyces sp. NPDC014344 TaxID=3364871 RepID=UPI0036F737DE